MKTAEEMFTYGNKSGKAYEFDHSCEVISVFYAIRIAKEYAKQVAEQALKDAADSATLIDDGTSNCNAMSIDKQSILETEIKLP